MKPRERKPEVIYRIIDLSTQEPVGVYSRAYCDEYDFRSPSEARSANCHDIHSDETKFGIAKYKITYEFMGMCEADEIKAESL